MQNFRALGATPPDPRASGGWGLYPQTPSFHWPPAAGGSAPRPPKHPPPLRIFGYAPVYDRFKQALILLSLNVKSFCFFESSVGLLCKKNPPGL